MAWTNQLYFGDNLAVLRESIGDESIDLIYLDPPFNSQATYNVLFRAPTGEHSQAQIEAFEDTWHWENETAERAFDEVMQSGNTNAAEMLRAMRSVLKENDLMAYLTMMTIRLLELHRVLKPTGNIYLHCDPTASHYLKILMDAVFGLQQFRNEIIWKRTNARSTPNRWPRMHDTLLFYSKSDAFLFRSMKVAADLAKLPHTLITGPDGKKYQTYELTGAGVTQEGQSGKPWHGFDPARFGRHWAQSHLQMNTWDELGFIHWPRAGSAGGFPRRRDENPFDPESRTITMGDVWADIDRINQAAQERLGYPTQKPLALLERILLASSRDGDTVLDPFCGCGSTIHAAQKLGRRWIGIDITHLAISLIEKRLNGVFPGIQYEVHGTPKDIAGARDLADRNKYQFQWWAVSLVDAVPYGGKKKGADTGIDGMIYFKPDGKQTEKAIVSVKGGGHVSVDMIRTLGHVVDREQAKIGVFVTLTPPTGPMQVEAIKAGFYASPYHGNIAKIQICTIAELFAGKKPIIPFIDPTTFRRARPENIAEQPQLFA